LLDENIKEDAFSLTTKIFKDVFLKTV